MELSVSDCTFKPAAKAGLIFHFFQRGNSNSPRTTITGKSFEVLFNIRQKSWRVGVPSRPHLGRRGRTDYQGQQYECQEKGNVDSHYRVTW
jgi:hypothetical protein